jgi:hypothetical protein
MQRTSPCEQHVRTAWQAYGHAPYDSMQALIWCCCARGAAVACITLWISRRLLLGILCVATAALQSVVMDCHKRRQAYWLTLGQASRYQQTVGAQPSMLSHPTVLQRSPRVLQNEQHSILYLKHSWHHRHHD